MGNSGTKASTEGYRIIKIAPHSPAQAVSIIPISFLTTLGWPC